MSTSVEKFLDQLRDGLITLLEEAREQGRKDVLSYIRGFGGQPAVAPRRAKKAAPAAPAEKARKKRKNPWATMTPQEKAARVRKMLAGRGLKPKSKTKKPKAKAKKKRKNPWDAMTPEQREARIKKMLAARGLKPKKASAKK